MNKRVLLMMLLVTLTLAIAACGGDDSDQGAERPIVRLKIGDRVFEQDVYSYCWPQSADNWECDVNEAARENPALAAVTAGDQVTFVVEDSPGAIKSFTATLLDGQGGVQDLGAGTEGAYNALLEDGRYRVRVDVEYADVEGVEIDSQDTPYVSYVFGLDVSGVMAAMQPTETPTPLPTDTPIPTETPTNTPEPTPTNTAEPTTTPEPTGEPVEVVTEEPAEGPIETTTEEPAEAAILLPTEETAEAAIEPAATEAVEAQGEESAAQPAPEGPAAMATGDLGEIAIAGTVTANLDGNLVPVTGAQVSYTLVSTASPADSGFGTTVTNARGQFSFPPIPIHDTDQITVKVDMRGYQSQTIQRTGAETANSGGIFDAVIAPQPGVAAPQPGAPVGPAAAAGPSLNLTPALTLVYGGRVYRPVGYQFCETAASGERLCAEQPVSGVTQERLHLLRGTDAQLKSSGERPQEIRIEYLTDSGVATGQPETRRGDNTTLFTITPESGNYIMAVKVTWANQDATYFFRIVVSD